MTNTTPTDARETELSEEDLQLIEHACALLADPDIDNMTHMGIEETVVTQDIPALIASHRAMSARVAELETAMTFEDQIRRRRESLGWTEWQILSSSELLLWLEVIEKAWQKTHTPIIDLVASGNAEADVCEALMAVEKLWSEGIRHD
jgi:hypothetical protein